MPDAYFFPATQSQQGYTHPSASPTPENFTWNYFGNESWDVGRMFIVRFTDVSLPPGATITAASVIYRFSGKNPQDAQTIGYNFKFEETSAASGVLVQDSLPLRENYAEEGRLWNTLFASQTMNWTSKPAPATNLQDLPIDVTAKLQQAWTTNTGRHMSLSFMLEALSESGDLAVENTATGRPATLKITYTGGTAENSVVLINENPNFVGSVITEDDGRVRPNMYKFNSFFGTHNTLDTYQVMANDGAIVAPFGGNICKITAGAGGTQTAIYLEPIADEGYNGFTRLVPGEWLTLTASVYVPTGLSRVKCVTWPSSAANFFTYSYVRDAWTRIYISFQYSLDYGIWAGVQTDQTPPDVGEFWYLANVNLTRGRYAYPHFDGNTTDEPTYGRTYDWGGGTTGKRNGGLGYTILDSSPTVTLINPLPSASTHTNILGEWTYNDPHGEAQLGYRLEARKKKVQG